MPHDFLKTRNTVTPFLSLALAVTLHGACQAESQSTPEYPDHARLLVVRDEKGNERPVKTAADWEVRRGHILAHLQEVMGPLPGKEKRCPLEVKVLETHQETGYRAPEDHVRQRARRSRAGLAAGSRSETG